MERSIPTRDGLVLWAETFGDRRCPPVLLVMGATAPGIVWPDELCRLLAAAGYYVVRYDHRDTGRSDRSYAEYDLSTMAEDAAAVITGTGAGPAHVVGQSAGGMISLLLALGRPELVRSLVLLSTSPDAGPDVQLPPCTGLSDPLSPVPGGAGAAAVAERVVRPVSASSLAAPPEERPSATVDSWRGLVGPDAPFDRAYWTDLVERVAAHSRGPDTSGRHFKAMSRTPPLSGSLGALDVPTLIVHGEQDRVFPMEHAEALHRAVPRARLQRILRMGHIFPPGWSAMIAGLILGHLHRTCVPAATGQAR